MLQKSGIIHWNSTFNGIVFYILAEVLVFYKQIQNLSFNFQSLTLKLMGTEGF